MAVQKHLSSFVLSNKQYQEHQEGRTLAEKQLGLELCYCGIVGQAALDQCVQQHQGEGNAGNFVASSYHDDDDFDVDDDIYIMMSVCVSVCHEKSSLPLQVCDFLSENVWVKIFFCEFFFFEFFFWYLFLKNFFLKIFFLYIFFEFF